jgi:ABC-type nitrate/sulfonate/bicarbonate transport system substrate-binding protein
MTRSAALPSGSSTRPLRVGFLALTDAAPLIVAEQRGFFLQQGLRVTLQREVGWATIREKILYGELDAAQAPAPMLWSAQLGLGCAPHPVLTAFVFNQGGNALTLSNELHAAGVRDAVTLRTVGRTRRGESRLTLGVVFPFSSHHLHLCRWLQQAGIVPERDVRIAIVPPAQMFRNLEAGTIDGYWSGEPWNSIAVRAGIGWCPTWSAAESPGHVEKVLMVTERLARTRAAEHSALVVSLSAAAEWCDDPAHAAELAEMLGATAYLNLPSRVIAPALLGEFDCGHGRVERAADFLVFHREGANVPTVHKAAALQDELSAAGFLPADVDAQLPSRLFREDLHRHAIQSSSTHEILSTPDLPAR